MGKIKKKRLAGSSHKVSLERQINETQVKKRNRELKIRFRTDEEEKVVDSSLSKQILNQVRCQQQELNEDYAVEMVSPMTSLGNANSSDEDDPDSTDINVTESEYHNPVIDEEDEKALEKFMDANPTPRLTLADLIMDKVNEKHTEIMTQFSDVDDVIMQELEPRVKDLFLSVREVLSKYRTGRLPKAFKIIPKLKNWEQILYITDPSCWSAAAMYEGTRIFASNLKEPMAQRFYNLVLLPRIRDDISEYKRLNFHLYQALRKALFKPGAFMKGIVIPMCEAGCTLREAVIVGSVIARYSIPMLHSAATILKLSEMKYNGASSIFLRVLLEKKYALPYRVIDAVVFHFLKFEQEDRELPVLWHQSLLAFVQYYKSNMSSEQKDALRKLLRSQPHHIITQNIRRELDTGDCRDTVIEEPPQCSIASME